MSDILKKRTTTSARVRFQDNGVDRLVHETHRYVPQTSALGCTLCGRYYATKHGRAFDPVEFVEGPATCLECVAWVA